MRYDLNILWVEDTATYYQETKEILEGIAEDNGISVKFHYIQDVEEFLEKIKENEKGFRLYDIYFIDYNLSSDILGSQLISNLRTKNFDSDILFYSSDKEPEIRKMIADDIGSFEGVYVANKLNFEEKGYLLINKNARRLTSLANIRGYLMDQTSENDFTIQSYILAKFNKLNDEQKEHVTKIILNNLKQKMPDITKKFADEVNNLETSGIKNIKRVMGLSSDLLPLNIKYQVFSKMMEFDTGISFDDITVEQYIDEIVKARNTLAHKKLDLCKRQEYILFYDTIKQLENRKCPDDCVDHNNDFKISIDEWKELRKKIHSFGKKINDVQQILYEDEKIY